jgi:5-methylcytosine-specific restriction protein A
MSNRRRPTPGNPYRSGFLKSAAWFARRDRWFRHRAATGMPISCALCGVAGDRRSLELHHVDYAGVVRTTRGWRSLERDGDLMPLHPACHELLHQLIDRDTVLSRQRSRRDATEIALALLRNTVTPENWNA